MLIIIAIVIGVAIAGSGIISNILIKQVPSGNELVLNGFYWWWEEVDNKYVIYIRGVATNVGTDRINITDTWVSINGIKYYLNFTRVRLKPNEWNEVFAYGAVDNLPKSSKLVVFVKYCTIKECSISFTYAYTSQEYLLKKVVVTIPMYSGSVSTVTRTITQTITTTTTIPVVVSSTITMTQTQTVTSTTTTTMTTTITKPAWVIEFSTCYGIDNYVYVYGYIDREVNKDAEIVPYVMKVYECNRVLGCRIIGVVPFGWKDNKTIIATYGPIKVSSFNSIKIEIWSIDINSSSYRDKIYEETIDTNVRCV